MIDIFKKPYIIVSFKSVEDALNAEESFRSSHVEGRLIPLPSFIKAGCGMCWYSYLNDKESVIDCINCNKIKYENFHQNL